MQTIFTLRHLVCRTIACLTLAATMLSAAHFASAQTPLKFVVPYPAGGAADQISRLVAQETAQVLGQPIVIDNKAGAAGMIAADSVLHAPADGTTFFVGSNAPIVINAAIYERMPYDPERDFVPVSGMGKSPLLLVTRKGLGAASVAELLAQRKKATDALSMGSASSGNITHLAGEYAASQLGFKVTHVPYKGSAPAITDMMGGNIDIMFDALPSCMGPAKAGRITPLAILDSQRFPRLPGVPTLDELGYKGLEASAWFGLMARTGTSRAIIDAMNKAVNIALQKPELIEKLRNIGAQPMPGDPAQFGQFIASERKQWVPVAKSLGVRAE